jgi:hypothetical protein
MAIHIHLPALLKKKVTKDAAMTFRQVLGDPEGRKLIDQIEEYISDLRRYNWKHPDHEKGLKSTIAELKRKTGYNYTYTKDAQSKVEIKHQIKLPLLKKPVRDASESQTNAILNKLMGISKELRLGYNRTDLASNSYSNLERLLKELEQRQRSYNKDSKAKDAGVETFRTEAEAATQTANTATKRAKSAATHASAVSAHQFAMKKWATVNELMVGGDETAKTKMREHKQQAQFHLANSLN